MARLVELNALGLALLLASTTPAACTLTQEPGAKPDYACLRETYSQPPAQWPAPHVDDDVAWQELGPLPERAPSPAGQPFSEARAELGEQLFFDPKLSRSGQIACASCHEPDLAFADGRKVSFGHDRQAGRRNSPSVVMSGFTRHPFWDGRAQGLEGQALMPVVDPLEMAFSIEGLLARLNADSTYRERFAAVFGEPVIRADMLRQALGDYQRTLVRVARNTRFERFLRGRHEALNDQQLHGLHLYRTKARCMNCHFGPALSDDQFHNAGMTYYGRKYEDLGRYEVTGKTEDVGRFRTPSLRLVSRTGPWIHNGLFPNLMGVLNFYNVGMPRPKPTAEQQDDPLFPQTSARFKPLDMSRDELNALRSFLDTL
ncbi:cytochrome-c peroxidase [Stutzerimonas stutzeri]|uniref:cytochrome-c peroxidase n=1 Tax=Stutzerimonas sp. S1 TaxID=3030652 RepID=UPI002224FD87|nr:cytochrome c peroxidase [Stutzerimonas sp. S1]MCW3149488.1 cytochrome-c peroxidase [Stutzerimonas sp. S1]